TLACAECHDHKYDPFTTRDFYELAAFFGDVQQWGVYADYHYTPEPELRGIGNDHPFPPEIEVGSPYLQQRRNALGVQLTELTVEATKRLRRDAAQRLAFEAWRDTSRAWLERHPDGWVTLDPQAVWKVDGTNSVPAEHALVRDDRSVTFPGKDAPHDRLELALPPGGLAALRLELLPDSGREDRILRGGGNVGTGFSPYTGVVSGRDMPRDPTAPLPFFLVQLAPGSNGITLAAAIGARARQAGFGPNQVVWEFPRSLTQEQMISRLNMLSSVQSYIQDTRMDPLTSQAFPNAPLFNRQWHLLNTGQGGGQPGIDARVIQAWDQVRGTGVTIGIVDDGVDWGHPDLQPNFSFLDSADFAATDNPTPFGAPGPGASHGSAVGGVAAARGFNGFGVTGVAPNARIASMRAVAVPITALSLANAVVYRSQSVHIYNHSWGSAPFGLSYANSPLLFNALNNSLITGRGGLGSIHVFAGGNSGDEGIDSNFQFPNNHPGAITVASIGNNGVRASYSQMGSNIFLAAPSNGGPLGITTTATRGTGDMDQNGNQVGSLDFTSDFGGTSSAAPVVSGVIALMLQARPNLTYRDVQAILAKTARKVDQGDFGWMVNQAGYNHNYKYGFGMVDALAAVNLAKTWTLLPQQQQVAYTVNVNQVIPDFNTTGITSTINVPNNMIIERVALTHNATHPRAGDLQITVTAPSGTQSIMSHHVTFEQDFGLVTTRALPSTWMYTSVRNFGEGSQGNWTVNVQDRVGGFEGTWESYSLTFYGYAAPNGGGGGGGGGVGSDGSADFLFEPNNTADKAFNFGALTETREVPNLRIASTTDRDWFRFTTTATADITAQIDITGSAVLQVRMFVLIPGTLNLVELGTGQGTKLQAGGTQKVTWRLPANLNVFVWVYGFNGSVGNYNLTLGMTA
ncbi:MAG TPA: S8 family serine peptidase, partial [Gemmatales bacterium]|nr:S8 family serine peptidase [Gemmatales bacterium]